MTSSRQCALVLVGESFRLGSQNTRVRGVPESRDPQFAACKSHVEFMDSLLNKHGIETDVYICSYTTPYTQELLDIYGPRVKKSKFYEDPIGTRNIYQAAIGLVEKDHDFVLIVRVDVFLKPQFTEIFDPNSDKILFASICWKKHCMENGYLRANDTITQVPSKHMRVLDKIEFGNHSAWHGALCCPGITTDDVDTMLRTYHDSDSEKDWNPLYYIVNRPETQTFHSEGEIFNK